MNILIIVKDLALREKIRGSSTPEGGNLIFARSLEQARERVHACATAADQIDSNTTGIPSSGIPSAGITAASPTIGTTIVDLNGFDTDPQELVMELRTLTPNAKLIGFCSHVETQRIAAAKVAGFASVLPRSRFFATLPEILGS